MPGVWRHRVLGAQLPIFEVMTMTDELSELVDAPTRVIEQMAISQGMSTLRESGIALAAAGITTLDEVRRVVGGKRRATRGVVIGA